MFVFHAKGINEWVIVGCVLVSLIGGEVEIAHDVCNGKSWWPRDASQTVNQHTAVWLTHLVYSQHNITTCTQQWTSTQLFDSCTLSTHITTSQPALIIIITLSHSASHSWQWVTFCDPWPITFVDPWHTDQLSALLPASTPAHHAVNLQLNLPGQAMSCPCMSLLTTQTVDSRQTEYHKFITAVNTQSTYTIPGCAVAQALC